MFDVELFEPFPVSGGQLREFVDGWRDIDALDALEGQIEAAHRAALDGIEGVIAPYAREAVEPAYDESRRVREVVDFARGVLGWFGLAVDDFNLHSTAPRSIVNLNAFYREQVARDFGLESYETAIWQEIDRELRATLRAEHALLEAHLDAAADEVCLMLRRGPNGTDLHRLFVAGTLPIGGGYSGREFTVEAWKQSLIQRLGTGNLPSLTQALGALSPDDRADLLNDVELMTAARDELSLDAATGARDARAIREGTVPGESYYVYQRLAWLNAYLPFADANLLTGLGEAQRAYAEAYLRRSPARSSRRARPTNSGRWCGSSSTRTTFSMTLGRARRSSRGDSARQPRRSRRRPPAVI